MKKFTKHLTLLAAVGLALSSANAFALSWDKDTHTVYAGNFDGVAGDELLLIAKSHLGSHAIVKQDGNNDYNLVLEQWVDSDYSFAWSAGRILVGDVNNDNYDDIIVQTDSSTYILGNDSNGELSSTIQTISSSHLGLNWSSSQSTLHIGDFNGDDRADLLLQPNNPNSETAILHAAANGTFNSTAQTFTGETQAVDWSTYYRDVVIGDFNNDGKDDVLLVANEFQIPIFLGDDDDQHMFMIPSLSNPHNVIFQADSSGSFTSSISGRTWEADLLGLDWNAQDTTILAGDFDGDGTTDLLLQSASGDSYFVNLSGGTPSTTTVASVSGVNFDSDDSALTVLDSDGNGTADLLVTQSSSIKLVNNSNNNPAVVTQSGVTQGVTAVISYNVNGQAGVTTGNTTDTFIFNGNGSNAANTYCWDWDNDGTCETVESKDPVATRVFLDAGTYTVRLIVKDFNGVEDSVTQSVVVDSYTYPEIGSSEPTYTEPTADVGSMDGSFSVTPNGAATYGVQIAVPPGRNNMQPVVSLNYSSQGGSASHVGHGWNISGLSSISRCRDIKERGEITQQIQWDNTDGFCIDGQRLIPISGTNGYDGTVYRTEMDGYAKITSHSSSSQNGPQHFGPDSFTVQTKDGKIHTYGVGDNTTRTNPTNPSIRASWYISQTKDTTTNGNAINFNYEASNDNIRIASISYTSNSSGTDTRFVRFNYDSDLRPDTSIGYMAGMKTRLTKRLDNITTEVNGKNVYRYKLRYDNTSYYTGLAATASRLEGITQCAFDGSSEVCLPEATFTYSTATLNFEDKENVGFEMNNSELDRHYMLDMNGDGIQDFIYYDKNKICLSRHPAGSCVSDKTEYSWVAHFGLPGESGGFSEQVTVVDIDEINSSKTEAKYAIPIDYLNDGRQDLMVPMGSKWGVLRFSASSSDYSNCADDCFTIVDDIGVPHHAGYKNQPKITDFNGDGYVDILWYETETIYESGRNWIKVYLKMRLGGDTGFASSADIDITNLSFYRGSKILTQYDPVPEHADTLSLVTLADYDMKESNFASIWNNFVLSDIDADGDVDILYQASKQTEITDTYGNKYTFRNCTAEMRILEWDQSQSVANELDEHKFLDQNFGNQNVYTNEGECYSNVLPIDINSDGLVDLVYPDSDDKKWFASINRGNQSFDDALDLGLSTSNFPIGTVRPTDINADGKIDLLGLKSNRVQLAIGQATGIGFINADPDVIYFTEHSGLYADEKDVIGDELNDILVDINNDGYTDVVWRDNGIKATFADADGFDESTTILIDNYLVESEGVAQQYNQLTEHSVQHNGATYSKLEQAESTFWNFLRVVDLDGDGQMELAYVVPTLEQKSSVGYTYFEESCSNDLRSLTWNGSAFSDANVVSQWDDSGCVAGYTFGDITGNGLADIVAGVPYESEFVNGTLVEKGYPYWQIFPNSGGTFGSMISTSISVDPEYAHHVDVVDYDLDGSIDIIVDDQQIVTAHINLNTLDDGVYQFLPQILEFQYFGAEDASLVKIADINGDGLADLVRGNGTKLNYAMNRSAKPYLLTEIDNGTGILTKIKYSTLADGSVYEAIATHDANGNVLAECSDRLLCAVSPMPVVKSHEATSGYDASTDLPTFTTYSYKYHDLRVDKFGHGVLGFKTFTVEDNNPYGEALDSTFTGDERNRAVKSISYFDNTSYDTDRKAYPKKGQVVKSENYLHGRLMSRTSNTFAVHTTATNANQFDAPYGVFPVTTIEETFKSGDNDSGLFSSSLVEYLDYDYLYGNAKRVRTTSADGVITDVESTYWEETDSTWVNSWFIGRLKETSVTKDRLPGIYQMTSNSGANNQDPDPLNETRKSSFTYYSSTGLLRQEVVEPGNDDPLMTVTKSYVYDGYGNTVSETVSGQGFDDRQANTVFDIGFYNAVFPQEINNNAVANAAEEDYQTTTFNQYDEKFGKAIEVTGVNGVKAYSFYDAFGRDVKQVSHEGTYVKTTYDEYAEGNRRGLVISKFDSTNGYTETYFDELDREILTRTRSYRAENTDEVAATDDEVAPVTQYVLVKTDYDELGTQFRTSQPYTSSAATLASVHGSTPDAWLRTYHDRWGRPYSTYAPFITIDDYSSTSTSYTYSSAQSSITNSSGDTVAFTRPIVITTVTDQLNDTKSEYRTADGEVIRIVDEADKSTYYDYDIGGKLAWTKDPLGVVTHVTYDLRGNKRSIEDENMGTWHYVYNAMGELTEQTDAKGQTTQIFYDALGRIEQRTEEEFVEVTVNGQTQTITNEYNTYWRYDEGNKAKGKLHRIEQYDENLTLSYQEHYRYDGLGRAAFVVKEIDGNSFAVSTEFDGYGRPLRSHLPQTEAGSISIENVYDVATGFLTHIKNVETGEKYYQVNALSAYGHVSEGVVGQHGIATSRYYDSRTGYLTSVISDHGSASGGALQNLHYDYHVDGNFKSRTHLAAGANIGTASESIKEVFEYDNRDRLTTVNYTNSIDGLPSQVNSYTYDAVGNIKTKYNMENGATYDYGSTQRHRVKSVGSSRSFTYDGNGNMLSDGLRNLVYNRFNKPSQMSDSDTVLTFGYDANRSRISKQVEGGKRTTYVGGVYEKIQDGENSTHRFFISGALASIIETRKTINGDEDASAATTSYMLKDHIGSTDVILEYNTSTGALLDTQLQSFGAFGERRNTNWADENLSSLQWLEMSRITSKGYTGHEMDDEVGLINMGGRIYSPELGRFTSPDPHVQDPGNPQNLNRYSYVWNNPLTNTDPSGFYTKPKENKWRGIISAAVSIGIIMLNPGMGIAGNIVGISGTSISIISGLFTGIAAGAASAAISSGGDLQAIFSSAVISGVTGSLMGAMHYFSPGTGSVALDKMARSALHGTIGGLRSVVTGGKFKHGFMSAAFTEMVGPAGQSGGLVQNTVVSVMIGGTAAKLSGGKFANGAVSAAFVYLLNHENGADETNSELSFLEKQKIIDDWKKSLQDQLSYIQELDNDQFAEYYFLNFNDNIYGLENSARDLLTNRIEKELTLLVSKNAHVDIPFNSVDVAATVAGRSKQPGLQVISRAWGVTKKVGKKLAGEVFGVSRCDVQDCESYWGRLRREE